MTQSGRVYLRAILIRQRSHTSTLFPYTTLFRSEALGCNRGLQVLSSARARGDRSRRRALQRVRVPDRDELPRLPKGLQGRRDPDRDRKSTRLNSSHLGISYAVFCLKNKSTHDTIRPCVPSCHINKTAITHIYTLSLHDALPI